MQVWAVVAVSLVRVAAWNPAGPDLWPEVVRETVAFAVGALTELEEHGADVSAHQQVGYLPQRLDGLDEEASAMANVQSVAPASPAGAIRNQLARLLLRGHSADRPVSSLSGGERFRVSLAKLLLAEPPAQLLILDEPTNNLDIATVGQLTEPLDAYRGALLVVSHDFTFLDRIGIDTVVELGQDRRMRQRRDLDV